MLHYMRLLRSDRHLLQPYLHYEVNRLGLFPPLLTLILGYLLQSKLLAIALKSNLAAKFKLILQHFPPHARIQTLNMRLDALREN